MLDSEAVDAAVQHSDEQQAGEQQTAAGRHLQQQGWQALMSYNIVITTTVFPVVLSLSFLHWSQGEVVGDNFMSQII